MSEKKGWRKKGSKVKKGGGVTSTSKSPQHTPNNTTNSSPSVSRQIATGFSRDLEDIVEVSDGSLPRSAPQGQQQQNGELCVNQGVLTFYQHPHTNTGEKILMPQQQSVQHHHHLPQYPPPLPLPTSPSSLSPTSPRSPATNLALSPKHKHNSPTRHSHLHCHSAPSFSQYINSGKSTSTTQQQVAPPQSSPRPDRPPKSSPPTRGSSKPPPCTPPSSPPVAKQPQSTSPHSPVGDRPQFTSGSSSPKVTLAKPYSRYNSSSGSQHPPNSPTGTAGNGTSNTAATGNTSMTRETAAATSAAAAPVLPKLNPPPKSLPVSRSTKFSVKADIESPPVAGVKSWPGSPVKEQAYNIQADRVTDDVGAVTGTAEKDGGKHSTSSNNGVHSSKTQGNDTIGENGKAKPKGDNSRVNTSSQKSENPSSLLAKDSTIATRVDSNTTQHSSDTNTMPAALISHRGSSKGEENGQVGLNRNPSFNKSKSDEALAGVRIRKSDQALVGHMTTSTNSGRRQTAEDDQLNSSFDSAAAKGVFSSRPAANGKLSSRGRSGTESPGSESVASLMSQATVITHTAGPLDSQHNPGAQKHTLGELLKHIDLKSQSLLERDDYTGATTLPDLTFLAHQSRYNADPQIKRRLMSRLANCRIVDIFLRVFQSVHNVDYLKALEPPTPPITGDGKPPHPVRAAQSNSPRIHGDSPRMSGDGSDRLRQRPVDMMSEPGVDARSLLSERLHNVPHSMKNLRAVLTLLVNCTDKNSSVCEQCIQSPLVPMLLEELSQPHFHGTEAMRDQNRMYLVKGYLGILLNVIKQQPDTRDMYREAGVVKVLQQYLKSSLLMVKTRTLLLLSYVISEAENDVINASERHLGLLVKMLQGALDSEGHFSKKYGLGAAELASAINRFASCESNKSRLARRDVLPLYNRLLSAESSDEEKMLGAKGVWSLAFSEENRGVIQQDTQCLQALEQLETTNHREEIRKTASGALWVIREHHIPVRPIGSEYSEDPELSQHVLISYQWGAKSLVFKLKERLKAAGYKVCTDVENTAVPIMDGMAAAVSQAAVVLLCLSHRFKESPSCRTEAEFAWHGGRPLIPVKLQPHYSPEGWLLPLVDARLTFDLSSDEYLDTLLPNLFREIGNRGRARAIEQFDVLLGTSSSSLPKIQDAATQTTKVRDTAEKWSCDEVHRWLKANDLSGLADRLKHVNGELLLEIRRMQKDAPESFYNTLKNELKLNFLSVLKFTRALDSL